MNIWLIQTGEFHPFQEGARKMRTAMLADSLRARGNSIVWLSTNFFHPTKTLLYPGYKKIELEPGYEIRMIPGLPYFKNVSLRRFFHYKLLERRFRKLAAELPKPDFIVTALPTYDLCAEAVRYGKKNGIPVFVDIQDLWPDIFVDQMPAPLRGIAKAVLFSDFKKVDQLLQDATGIIGCSDAYLNWGIKRAHRSRKTADAVFYHGYPKPALAEPSALKPELRSLVDSLRSKFVFSFVGTFGKSYDLPLIVETARRLEKSNPDVPLVLAVTCEQFNSIQKQSADLGNITLAGWLDKNSIACLLDASDVGLATYTADAPQSLSYKPFEYLAYGLPLLSSLQGEMDELIKKHQIGFTYQPGNIESFVAGVQFFADYRAQMTNRATQARAVFDREFTVEQIYDSYANHIDQTKKNFTTVRELGTL